MPDTRLPKNTKPSLYNVDLIISNDGDVSEYRFEGRVKITADVAKENSANDGRFVINADHILSINDSSLSLRIDGAIANIESVLYDFERQLFVINYPIQQAQSFQIAAEMTFSGSIGNDGRGLF